MPEGFAFHIREAGLVGSDLSISYKIEQYENMPWDISSAKSQDTIAADANGKHEEKEQDVAKFRHCRLE
jgi:hypothetical protein